MLVETESGVRLIVLGRQLRKVAGKMSATREQRASPAGATVTEAERNLMRLLARRAIERWINEQQEPEPRDRVKLTLVPPQDR